MVFVPDTFSLTYKELQVDSDAETIHVALCIVRSSDRETVHTIGRIMIPKEGIDSPFAENADKIAELSKIRASYLDKANELDLQRKSIEAKLSIEIENLRATENTDTDEYKALSESIDKLMHESMSLTEKILFLTEAAESVEVPQPSYKKIYPFDEVIEWLDNRGNIRPDALEKILDIQGMLPGNPADTIRDYITIKKSIDNGKSEATATKAKSKNPKPKNRT